MEGLFKGKVLSVNEKKTKKDEQGKQRIYWTMDFYAAGQMETLMLPDDKIEQAKMFIDSETTVKMAPYLKDGKLRYKMIDIAV